ERALAAVARRPFDLGRGPLLRAVLASLSGEEHVLLLAMHHIVSDAWSTGVLVRDLTALYRAFAAGQPSPLPALELQYADFAIWQRSWLEGGVLARERRFWRERLAGVTRLELPTDRVRPARGSGRGGRPPRGGARAARGVRPAGGWRCALCSPRTPAPSAASAEQPSS